MAHTERINKRLKNLTEQDWANMRVADRTKNEALKNEIEYSFESQKKSPYGWCWLTQGMRRYPTNEELHVISERNYDAKTTFVPTSQ